MPIRRGKQPPFLCYCRCCWRWFFSALPRFVFAVVFSEPALQPFNIETMLLCIIWLKTSDRFTSSQVIWSFIVVFFPIFSLVYLVDLHFIFIHITHVLNEMFLLLFFFFFLLCSAITCSSSLPLLLIWLFFAFKNHNKTSLFVRSCVLQIRVNVFSILA